MGLSSPSFHSALSVYTDIPMVLTRPLEPKAGRENQSVVLSCDFKPPPKAVQWYKEDTPLAPSDKYKMRLEGHMAELRVLRLSPADTGVYRCQAGNAQSSAEVTVEGREEGTLGPRGLGVHQGVSEQPWTPCSPGSDRDAAVAGC